MSIMRSFECDALNHDACVGTVLVMEQDGQNRYLCDCRCHKVMEQEPCPRCRGKGEVSVERHVAEPSKKEPYYRPAHSQGTEA